MDKVLVRPERCRQLPAQFSWLDQRLARARWFERASAESWLLYTFLVTVADAQGLSFYGDRALCQRLRLDAASLAAARERLQRLELIAYRAPLSQVLAVPAAVARAPSPSPSPSSSPPRPSAEALHGHLSALRQALRPRGPGR